MNDISNESKKVFQESWGWLIGVEYDPFAVTQFGDVFLFKGDEVYFLDTGSGEITLVAKNKSEFELKLASDESSIWLLSALGEDIKKKGVHPKAGECFSFITPPVLGGEYAADNVGVLAIDEHFRVTGDVHQQIKNLPDGATVKFQVTH